MAECPRCGNDYSVKDPIVPGRSICWVCKIPFNHGCAVCEGITEIDYKAYDKHDIRKMGRASHCPACGRRLVI